MAQPIGLGKGLSSLIPAHKTTSTPNSSDVGLAAQSKNFSNTSVDVIEKSSNFTSVDRLLDLDVDRIVPNPLQPRQTFNHRELEELVASIKEHGILQPLIVAKIADSLYELVAGERRLRAAKIAGLRTVPAIVRALTKDKEKLELALIENIQRQDLNPIEKARSYARLMDEFDLTQEQAAKSLGIQRPTLANALRMLTLPAEIQKALSDGALTPGHARAILSLDSNEERLKLFRRIMDGAMNVRDAEANARTFTRLRSATRPMDPILEDYKNRIQARFGTKVDIKKQGNAGSIVIHYYSKEEFLGLCKKLQEAEESEV